MVIKTHPGFDKHYIKRIRSHPKLVQKFKDRVKLFSINRTDAILEDHPLKGNKNLLRSFSITGDIRVIYYSVSDYEVIFLDIGSHNQVY